MHIGSQLIKLSFCVIFLSNLFSAQCLSKKHKLLFTCRFLHAKPTLLAKILRKYSAAGVYLYRSQMSKSTRSFCFGLWTPSPNFCQSRSAAHGFLQVFICVTERSDSCSMGETGAVWLGFSASKLNPSEIKVLLTSISLAIFFFSLLSYHISQRFFFFTHCKYFILVSLKYCQLEAATEQ